MVEEDYPDELFPYDKESDVTGISAVLVKEPEDEPEKEEIPIEPPKKKKKTIKKAKPERMKKEIYVDDAKAIYAKLESLNKAIPNAFSLGNAQSIWEILNNIMETYRKKIL